MAGESRRICLRRSTVYDYVDLWDWGGTLERMDAVSGT